MSDHDHKLALAHAYARALLMRHPGLLGIVLGGSVARGTDLPASDIDVWVYPRDPRADLGIRKQLCDGIVEDYDQRDPAELRAEPGGDGFDPYVAGFLRDAVILHDPDGEVAAAQLRCRRYLSSDAYLDAVLPGLREPVERNLREFVANAKSGKGDPLVAIRASSFCLWSLVDLACTQRGVAPGGFGVLRRLRAADADAAKAVEDALFRHWLELRHSLLDELLASYAGIAGQGSFEQGILAKVRWLAEHNQGVDAWFALWIAMGLKCKAVERGDVSGNVEPGVREAARRWTALLGLDAYERGATLAELLSAAFSAIG